MHVQVDVSTLRRVDHELRRCYKRHEALEAQLREYLHNVVAFETSPAKSPALKDGAALTPRSTPGNKGTSSS